MREQKKKEKEEKQRKKVATAEKRAAAAEKRAAVAEKKATIEAEKKATAEAKQAEKLVGDEVNRKRQAASYTTRVKQPRLGTDANVPSSSHNATTSPNVDQVKMSVAYVSRCIKKMKKMMTGSSVLVADGCMKGVSLMSL